MAINLRGCKCESFAFESESKSSKCGLESTVGLEYYITDKFHNQLARNAVK